MKLSQHLLALALAASSAQAYILPGMKCPPTHFGDPQPTPSPQLAETQHHSGDSNTPLLAPDAGPSPVQEMADAGLASQSLARNSAIEAGRKTIAALDAKAIAAEPINLFADLSGSEYGGRFIPRPDPSRDREMASGNTGTMVVLGLLKQDEGKRIEDVDRGAVGDGDSDEAKRSSWKAWMRDL